MHSGSAGILPLFELSWNEVALFLDFDGTLVDIVVDPAAVQIEDGVVRNLGILQRRLGGALAIVSGRPIVDIDKWLMPLVLPAAGVHGLTRRTADGVLELALVEEGAVMAVKEQLLPFVHSHPGLLLEAKWGAIALHYRACPQLGEACYIALLRAARTQSETVEFVRGKMVVEAKFAHHDKGTAVRRFMSEVPFRGRRPVFVGDDVTDEDGFAAAIELGGLAAKVGAGPSVATLRFASAMEFREWLRRISNQPEG